jgi:glycine/D-amino acid oxidase-like deaminating enzyme
VAETYDALIVGAGIVGCACARELAQLGMRVAVIEGDTAGSGATAAGMGQIVVMDDSPAQLALTRYSQQLWDADAGAHARSHDYLRCGTIWVAASAEEAPALEEKRHRYLEHGIACKILTGAQLAATEPSLRPGLAGGLLVPGDSVVYPPQSAAAFLAQAHAAGTVLIRGDVGAVYPSGVTLIDGRAVRGALTIVANGARAIELLPELPIVPKKGHLAITDRVPGYIHHQLAELGYLASAHAMEGDSVAFNIQPRSTGQVLIGSSRQPGSTAPEVEFSILGRMLARAWAFLPTLDRLSCLRAWTGFRAATADSLPLIGPHPWRPGIWLATGHEGLGITTSLATAKLLAAQLGGPAADIPATPYLPQRMLREPAYAG